MDDILRRINAAKEFNMPGKQEQRQWMPGVKMPPLPAVKRGAAQNLGGTSIGLPPVRKLQAQREDSFAQKSMALPQLKMATKRERMMQLARSASLTDAERQETKKAIEGLKPSFAETAAAQAAALMGDGAKQREIVQNQALAELLEGKLRGGERAAGTGVIHSLPFGKNAMDHADGICEFCQRDCSQTGS